MSDQWLADHMHRLSLLRRIAKIRKLRTRHPATEAQEGQAMYFVTRIQMGEAIDFDQNRDLLLTAMHCIESVKVHGGKCWRLWVQGAVLNQNHSKVFSLNGRWQEISTAVSVEPCFAFRFTDDAEESEHLYLAARDRQLVADLIGTLENLYELEPSPIDSLIEAHRTERVLSCEFIEPKQRDVILRTFRHSTSLGEFLRTEELPLSSVVALSIMLESASQILVDRLNQKAWCTFEGDQGRQETEWIPDMVNHCRHLLSTSSVQPLSLSVHST